jgi:hypothetical protein
MKKQMKRNNFVYVFFMLFFGGNTIFAQPPVEKRGISDEYFKEIYARVLAGEQIWVLPSTIEECYYLLDETVGWIFMNRLKNIKPQKLHEHYFSGYPNYQKFGDWIYSELLAPYSPKHIKTIRRVFIDENVANTFEMSMLIVIGYFYRLHGIDIETVNDLKEQELLIRYFNFKNPPMSGLTFDHITNIPGYRFPATLWYPLEEFPFWERVAPQQE